LDEGTITPAEAETMKANIQDQLEAAYSRSKEHHYDAEDWVTPEWEGIKVLDKTAAKDSGVDKEHLRDIGLKISHLPKEMEFHK
jgi:2-oxoglutarate dehydrogenase complex dehydrogenase (E1) component-like enzyme